MGSFMSRDLVRPLRKGEECDEVPPVAVPLMATTCWLPKKLENVMKSTENFFINMLINIVFSHEMFISLICNNENTKA